MPDNAHHKNRSIGQVFDDWFDQIDIERNRFEDSSECDFEMLEELKLGAEKTLRKLTGLTGSAVYSIDGTLPKGREISKSAQKGTWSSPRPHGDDVNFVVIEIVRHARSNQIHLTREYHLDVLEAYSIGLNRSSIPPKLGDLQKERVLTWVSRKPATIQLDIHGLQRLRDLYTAAEAKKAEITEAMKTLNKDYMFPELSDLAG